MHMSDLVPGIKWQAAERVALMRKGGNVRLTDYCPSMAAPGSTVVAPGTQLVMGLAWDVTNGVNIDLDASAIVLDANLNQLDLVYFGKVRVACACVHACMQTCVLCMHAPDARALPPSTTSPA